MKLASHLIHEFSTTPLCEHLNYLSEALTKKDFTIVSGDLILSRKPLLEAVKTLIGIFHYLIPITR